MNRWQVVALSALLGCFSLGSLFAAQPMTDTQIRDALIAGSIASYRGACPCPYNIMRNGRRCAGNSAYSKPGGASPICYPQDVTPAMIETFRRQLASK